MKRLILVCIFSSEPPHFFIAVKASHLIVSQLLSITCSESNHVSSNSFASFRERRLHFFFSVSPSSMCLLVVFIVLVSFASPQQDGGLQASNRRRLRYHHHQQLKQISSGKPLKLIHQHHLQYPFNLCTQTYHASLQITCNFVLIYKTYRKPLLSTNLILSESDSHGDRWEYSNKHKRTNKQAHKQNNVVVEEQNRKNTKKRKLLLRGV